MITNKGINNFKTLSFVYIPRIGDKEAINKYRTYFGKLTDAELVQKYDAIKQLFGVHQQGLYIIALHQALLKRFNNSPISIKENSLVSIN